VGNASDQKLEVGELRSPTSYYTLTTAYTLHYVHLHCILFVLVSYVSTPGLRELFENVDATSIIDFIKEVNFYHLV